MMQKDIRYLQERSVNINRITDRLVSTFDKFADEYLKVEGKFDPIYFCRDDEVVQYITLEYQGEPEKSVVLALDSSGLWILKAYPPDVKSNYLPTLRKGKQLKFIELPSKVQFQLVSDLPEMVKFFAQELMKREEQAQELLDKLEKIVEETNFENDMEKDLS